MPLDTRLDPREWRNQATAAQLESVISRLDLVVTTRLHGLVLALKNGVPALAVDPVAGGAKVSAQAGAWDWPAVITGPGQAAPGEPLLDPAMLGRWWDWCLSPEAAARARRAAAGTAADGTLTTGLLGVLTGRDESFRPGAGG